MKCSGRSVAAASRVIEIDEVLVATMASGLRKRTQRHENLALDRLVFGGGLDHQIGIAQAGHGLGIGDAGERAVALVLADLAGGDLAGEVLVDGGDRRSTRSLAMSCISHVVAGSATTWAMPPPIWPAPMMPILLMGPMS